MSDDAKDLVSDEGPQVAHWIANFSDGSTVTSIDVNNDFLNISRERRAEIIAMRLEIEPGKYATITRKVRGKHIEGIFYHLKAGRIRDIFHGRVNIPFLEERICFCYNSAGDSIGIMIDHHHFMYKLRLRERAIINLMDAQQLIADSKRLARRLGHAKREIVTGRVTLTTERLERTGQTEAVREMRTKFGDDVNKMAAEIRRLGAEPIVYSAKIVPVTENIVKLPINHSLLDIDVKIGPLEDEPEVEVPVAIIGLPVEGTLPRVFLDNDVEVVDFQQLFTGEGNSKK